MNVFAGPLGPDQILVLQEGRMVDRGTHAQLIAKEGVCAQLYQQPFAPR